LQRVKTEQRIIENGLSGAGNGPSFDDLSCGGGQHPE
jgi:hypothetical protein